MQSDPFPDNSEISILVVDDDQIVLLATEAYIHSFGFKTMTASDGTEAIQLLEKNSYDLVLTDMNMPFMDGMEVLKHTREKHPGTGVIVMTAYSEKYSYVDVINAGAIDFINKPILGDELFAKIKRAVREQTMMQKLKRLSIHDSLTGIFNRRHFDAKIIEELHRATRQKYTVFLALLDVDNFKEYNDKHGHQFGDNLLAEFGDILSSSARQEVDSVYRYGGDEFAVIIPQTTLEQAKKIVERIMTAYNKSDFNGTSLSAGLAEFIRNSSLSREDDIKDFIKRADTRLYKAKKSGKGKLVFSDQ